MRWQFLHPGGGGDLVWLHATIDELQQSLLREGIAEQGHAAVSYKNLYGTTIWEAVAAAVAVQHPSPRGGGGRHSQANQYMASSVEQQAHSVEQQHTSVLRYYFHILC